MERSRCRLSSVQARSGIIFPVLIWCGLERCRAGAHGWDPPVRSPRAAPGLCLAPRGSSARGALSGAGPTPPAAAAPPRPTRRCQKVPPSACESLPDQLSGRYRLQSRPLIEINWEGTICPTIVRVYLFFNFFLKREKNREKKKERERRKQLNFSSAANHDFFYCFA